jgi:hypothetical protein
MRPPVRASFVKVHIGPKWFDSSILFETVKSVHGCGHSIGGIVKTVSTRPAAATREIIFRLAAVGAAPAAVFHAVAMLSPEIARVEYEPNYPMWRHIVFFLIDGVLAWLFLRRPLWLVWAYGVLTLQILNGHGRGAWRIWMDEHRVDWISVAVSVLAPVVLCTLFVDWRERRRVSALAGLAVDPPRKDETP